MNRIKKAVKLSLIIIAILIFLPALYLAYDRSLMPSAPGWVSPPYVPDETWEQYATRYLQTNKQPNALEHYLKAFSLLDIEPVNHAWSSLRPILNSGWNKEYPEVEKLLTLNQQAIQEILTGTKLPYCEFPPAPFGKNAPDASVCYQKMQPLGNLIALSGKKYEHEKQFHKAMEYYLAGIKFGTEISQKNQDFSFMLNGISMINTNTRALLQLIKSSKLTSNDYHQVIQELGKIEKEQTTYADEIEAYYRDVYTRDYYDTGHPVQYYNALPPEAKGREFTGLRNYSKSFCVGYIFFNRGRILSEDYNFFNDMLNSATTESNPDSTVNKVNVREPPNKYFYVKIITFLVGGHASLQREIAVLRLSQIDAALQLYRLENRQWTKSIDDLKSSIRPIPLDPYTDKPFLWSKGMVNQPVVYSTGPDRVDDTAQVVFDPTNGTISGGDIF
jgi:tetratricopeptide (TPR) repeat protein